MLYVCDNCGHIEATDPVPEGDEWTCSVCHGHAAWEFPPERRNAAETHAARILPAFVSRQAVARNTSRIERP